MQVSGQIQNINERISSALSFANGPGGAAPYSGSAQQQDPTATTVSISSAHSRFVLDSSIIP